MNDVDYVARARSIKAFKLTRVMLVVLRRNPRFTLADVEAAGPETRRAAARVAGVRDPSEETWQLVVEMLREQATPRQYDPRP